MEAPSTSEAAPPPLVIGAVGGSGTRVVVEALQAAGCFFGSELNLARDSLPCSRFLRRWVPRVLRNDVDDAARTEMAADLRDALRAHRAGAPQGAAQWGVKNPRWVYLVGELPRLLPGCRFLHVVRDGRDMAFSRNLNQLRDYGDAVIASRCRNELFAVRAAALWDVVNRSVADAAERTFGDRYRRVRFEDVCGRPRESVAAILEFAGLPTSQVDVAAHHVRAPKTIGRHRSQPADVVARICEVAAAGLLRFRYGSAFGTTSRDVARA